MQEHLKITKELYFPDGTYHCVVASPHPLAETVVFDSQGFDFMKLSLQKNALLNTGYRGKTLLNIPYIPAARQDRVCNSGEPLSAKAVAQAINFLNFDMVLTMVPHSDVITALIDNIGVYELEGVFTKENVPELFDRDPAEIVAVAPDAGAAKRTITFAKKFGFGFLQANKVRDVSNGKILSIEVNGEIDPNKKYVVVDDICAMGRTFIGLGNVLIEKGAKEIELVLGHIDKTNGLDKLSDIFQKIYTTNSQAELTTENKNLRVIDVFA